MADDIVSFRINRVDDVDHWLKTTRARVRAEILKGVTRAALMVQRHTKEHKLDGQVLRRQTGRLIRSINVRQVESGDRIAATVGTNVEYARVHEFGFSGVVIVREHLRKTKTGFMATVRGHDRKIRLPERSFLRSALADKTQAVEMELAQAVLRAIKE